jgi:hypothetical protein
LETDDLIQCAESSGPREAAGVTLFLVVTACWTFGLASAELDWIGYSDAFVLIAVGLSVASVVLTGYLGRLRDALWLGWVPGAAILVIGISMTPDPGGDETGGAMIFIGGLVLFGWAFFFFPLIALGFFLRQQREKRQGASPTQTLDRPSI